MNERQTAAPRSIVTGCRARFGICDGSSQINGRPVPWQVWDLRFVVLIERPGVDFCAVLYYGGEAHTVRETELLDGFRGLEVINGGPSFLVESCSGSIACVLCRSASTSATYRDQKGGNAGKLRRAGGASPCLCKEHSERHSRFRKNQSREGKRGPTGDGRQF